jgi:hypothetical protein
MKFRTIIDIAGGSQVSAIVYNTQSLARLIIFLSHYVLSPQMEEALFFSSEPAELRVVAGGAHAPGSGFHLVPDETAPLARAEPLASLGPEYR